MSGLFVMSMPEEALGPCPEGCGHPMAPDHLAGRNCQAVVKTEELQGGVRKMTQCPCTWKPDKLEGERPALLIQATIMLPNGGEQPLFITEGEANGYRVSQMRMEIGSGEQPIETLPMFAPKPEEGDEDAER